MRNLLASRALIVAVSSSLLTAVALSGAAKAITDTSFTYSPARTGFLQIPAAAFVPVSSGLSFTSTGYIIRPSVNTEVCLHAPVNLPHGAKMTALTLWYKKGNTNLFPVVFYRQRMSDGASEDIVRVTPANAGVRTALNVTIANAAVAAVNNRDFNYSIFLCMYTTDSYVAGARIRYTYTDAGA